MHCRRTSGYQAPYLQTMPIYATHPDALSTVPIAVLLYLSPEAAAAVSLPSPLSRPHNKHIHTIHALLFFHAILSTKRLRNLLCDCQWMCKRHPCKCVVHRIRASFERAARHVPLRTRGGASGHEQRHVCRCGRRILVERTLDVRQ